MTDNLEALSGLIKKELENYEDKIDVGDVGTVVTIGDGIALIYGLKKVMMSELLLFPNDVYGMVMNLEENSVGCVLLGKDSLIHEGDIVFIKPEVKHWHGATKDSYFSHLAIEVPAEGSTNEWLEEVNDNEYNKLN